MFETLENLKKFIGMEMPTEKKEASKLKKEVRLAKKEFISEFRTLRDEFYSVRKSRKEVFTSLKLIQKSLNELTKRQPKPILSDNQTV